MKTIFCILFTFISMLLSAQTDNKLVLRKTSGNFMSSKFKVIELPQQMMVNWYDTFGVEHNDDKVLLYVVKDTLFFDVANNDTLVEALAYNQIESIKMFSVGKILLKPVALVSSIFLAYGTAGTIALLGYGLTSNYSSDRFALVLGGLLFVAIDVPLYLATKALWTGSNMTYKTEKWRQIRFEKDNGKVGNESSLNKNISKSGTAFAITSNGLIVTNSHVINGSTKINVKGVNGDFSKSYPANLLIEDKNNDLAILKIADSSYALLDSIPFDITSKSIDVGSNVYALGYPLKAVMGNEIKLTNGIISSNSGFKGDVTTYQITVPLQPGNSGGPLFDSNGDLVGVVNSKLDVGENVLML
jgi:hypothetical protein